MRASPLGQRLFRKPPAVIVPPVGTTWAAATDWFPSNANLTVERTGTSGFWAPVPSSAPKTNGTVIFTINAIGGAATANTMVGIGQAGVATYPGQGSSAPNDGISWISTGGIDLWGAGVVVTYAAWTTGDILKIIKTGAAFEFFKNNVSQGTITVTDAGYGYGGAVAGAAYVYASSGNSSAGLKVTADFSGW